MRTRSFYQACSFWIFLRALGTSDVKATAVVLVSIPRSDHELLGFSIRNLSVVGQKTGYVTGCNRLAPINWDLKMTVEMQVYLCGITIQSFEDYKRMVFSMFFNYIINNIHVKQFCIFPTTSNCRIPSVLFQLQFITHSLHFHAGNYVYKVFTPVTMKFWHKTSLKYL